MNSLRESIASMWTQGVQKLELLPIFIIMRQWFSLVDVIAELII